MLLNKILKIIFIVSLVLLIISLNFKLLALNFNFYKKEFSKLNVYEKIPDADKQALNLINYHNNKEELSNFFNDKEKLHLQDVKNLFQKLSLMFYISLILSIILLAYFIYTKKYKIIYFSFLIVGILIFILIILFLIPLTNFDKTFTQFHLILFSNNLWQFNPETDNLVNLFPLQFFYDITKQIIINTIISSFILIILALILKFKLNRLWCNPRISNKI